MNKYHFSAKFECLEFLYHGELRTAQTETKAVVKLAKAKLIEKMKGWNISGAKIIYFKIYKYEGGEEREVFLYEQ